MFRGMNLTHGNAEKRMKQFGTVKLSSVQLRPTETHNLVISDNGLAAYCFNPDSVLLRYSSGGMASGTVWDQISYDKIVHFQGRFIASDVRVLRGDKVFEDASGDAAVDCWDPFARSNAPRQTQRSSPAGSPAT